MNGVRDGVLSGLALAAYWLGLTVLAVGWGP